MQTPVNKSAELGFWLQRVCEKNTCTLRWRTPVGAPLGGPCAPRRQPSSCPSAPPRHRRPPSPVQDALAAAAAYELKTEDGEVIYVFITDIYILSSPFFLLI